MLTIPNATAIFSSVSILDLTSATGGLLTAGYGERVLDRFSPELASVLEAPERGHSRARSRARLRSRGARFSALEPQMNLVDASP
jgi:hypothetical protein